MRTDDWRHGEIATFPGVRGDVLGEVIVYNRRTGRHVKVRITSGSEAGVTVWPDRWLIGAGPCEHTCLDCGFRYRTSDLRQGFCPPCDRSSGAAIGASSDDHDPPSVTSVRPDGRPWGRVGRR